MDALQSPDATSDGEDATGRFVVALLVSIQLFAATQEDLLAIEAKLFPQIVLFDLDLDDKKIDGTVQLVVASESPMKAAEFAEMVRRYYPGSIRGVPLAVVVKSCREITPATPMSALFVVDDRCANYGALMAAAKRRKVVTFAYDTTGMTAGALITVDVKEKIRPMINVQALKGSGIRLGNGLLGIAKVVDE